jgi:ABC-type glycerol-3-phosphate transport system permease component
MNRSFLIIVAPALVVAAGYVVVLRRLGLTPNYLRLSIVLAGFLLAVWLVRRQQRRKTGPAPH